MLFSLATLLYPPFRLCFTHPLGVKMCGPLNSVLRSGLEGADVASLVTLLSSLPAVASGPGDEGAPQGSQPRVVSEFLSACVTKVRCVTSVTFAKFEQFGSPLMWPHTGQLCVVSSSACVLPRVCACMR